MTNTRDTPARQGPEEWDREARIKAGVEAMREKKEIQRRFAQEAEFDVSFRPVNLYQRLFKNAADLEPPTPDVLIRPDGVGLFYAGQVNELFGDPESGKTWISLAAVAELLMTDEAIAHFIDLDHNGWESIVSRLMQLGVTKSQLLALQYWEPDSAEQINQIVREILAHPPDIVVLDSIGELLPMYEANSHSADDFTAVHSHVLKPMARTGACVIGIDHLARSSESRAYGAIGTVAKRRVVRGTSIRVTPIGTFVPGQGGRARLEINKDTSGGLRRQCPDGKAGTFVLGTESGWSFDLSTQREQKREAKQETSSSLWSWILERITTEEALSGGEIVRLLEAMPSRPKGWGNNAARAELKAHTFHETDNPTGELVIQNRKYHLRS